MALLEQKPRGTLTAEERQLLEQRQDVDDLLGGGEIRLGFVSADRIRHVAKMKRRGVGEREHEAHKGNFRRFLLLFFGHTLAILARAQE